MKQFKKFTITLQNKLNKTYFQRKRSAQIEKQECLNIGLMNLA